MQIPFGWWSPPLRQRLLSRKMLICSTDLITGIEEKKIFNRIQNKEIIVIWKIIETKVLLAILIFICSFFFLIWLRISQVEWIGFRLSFDCIAKPISANIIKSDEFRPNSSKLQFIFFGWLAPEARKLKRRAFYSSVYELLLLSQTHIRFHRQNACKWIIITYRNRDFFFFGIVKVFHSFTKIYIRTHMNCRRHRLDGCINRLYRAKTNVFKVFKF